LLKSKKDHLKKKPLEDKYQRKDKKVKKETQEISEK